MADIDIGQITEALNDKSDRDLRNVDTTAKADAVIDYQEPTADNNYTWYRKYKSGWVEQGGTVSANRVREISAAVNLPIEMANTNYNVYMAPQSVYRTASNAWNMCIGFNIVSATQIIVNSYGLGDSDLQIGLSWEVKGFAA